MSKQSRVNLEALEALLCEMGQDPDDWRSIVTLLAGAALSASNAMHELLEEGWLFDTLAESRLDHKAIQERHEQDRCAATIATVRLVELGIIKAARVPPTAKEEASDGQ